jgi:hypothetical protein
MEVTKKPEVGLHAKLVAVGAAIKAIEKTGTNTHFNFKFVEASHAYERIRTELYLRGVFLHISLGEVEQQGTLTSVAMEMTFVDSESDEKQVITWHGYGSDKQDKGLAKAITSGVKSFLLTNLLIPSGVEPDAEGTDIVPASAPVVESVATEKLMELVALAKERGVPDAKMKTKVNSLGAKRAAEMTADQAAKLEKWIKTQKVAEDA